MPRHGGSAAALDQVARRSPRPGVGGWSRRAGAPGGGRRPSGSAGARPGPARPHLRGAHRPGHRRPPRRRPRRVRPGQRPAVEPGDVPVPLPPGPGPAAAGGRPAHGQRGRRLGGRSGHGRRGPRDERGAHTAGHGTAAPPRPAGDGGRRCAPAARGDRHPRRRGARRSGRQRADHADRQAGRSGRRPRSGFEGAGFAAEPARRRDLSRLGSQQRRDAGRLGDVPLRHHPHHRRRAPRR